MGYGICYEYRDVYSCIIVQTRHIATLLLSVICGILKDYLYIHPNVLEIYVKSVMCWVLFSVFQVRYIVITNYRKSSRFSVSIHGILWDFLLPVHAFIRITPNSIFTGV